MIAYIEGRIAERTENSAIIITDGGLGYEVFLTSRTLTSLPEKGGRVHFFASHIVREDAQEIFGFETWDERQTFELLITFNKIGARTAISILSQFSPDDLMRIVVEDDPTPLTVVSGIGKKTAQQIFLELKYKLKSDFLNLSSRSGAVSTSSMFGGGVFKDAVAGLVGLQYDEQDAATAVSKVVKESPDIDVSSAIRAALKLLSHRQ